MVADIIDALTVTKPAFTSANRVINRQMNHLMDAGDHFDGDHFESTDDARVKLRFDNSYTKNLIILSCKILGQILCIHNSRTINLTCHQQTILYHYIFNFH